MAKKSKYSDSRALRNAWRRFAELDLAADHASDMHKRFSKWVIFLGVIATTIAVLAESYTEYFTQIDYEIFGQTFTAHNALLILLAFVPALGSALLGFSLKLKYGDNWLSLRAGAEEIRKEIFFFRTVMQQVKDREEWLSERIAEILRHVHEVSAGDLVVPPYKKDKLPHQYNPRQLNSDRGFSDLLANDYIKYRLDDQVDWHNKKMAKVARLRLQLLVATYIFTIGGTLLSLLGLIFPTLPLWVAFTSSIAAAITSWSELRRMDATVQNYNKVVLELGIIRDHWYSLDGERRTGNQFYKLVNAVEGVLWTQHSQHISAMRKAVAEMDVQERNLFDTTMASPVADELEDQLKEESFTDARLEEATFDKLLLAKEKVAEVKEEKIIQRTDSLVDTIVETVEEKSDRDIVLPSENIEIVPERLTAAQRRSMRTRPHAFVVMPFGRKQGFDGQWIDFNAIYQELIGPSLEMAGFEPFRADDATETGDILTDMFQELLLADLAICDLSIDNANVFYELGIRHAFRKRGVVHIQSGRAYMPFDIFNVRTIPYHIESSGRPDPEFLDKDISTISRVTRDTWNSDRDAIHSPVFNLLTGLVEPDRKDLRTPAATGFWREYNEWRQRIEIAQRQKRIGDILLLTEEISNPLIKEEAIGEAGRALRSLGQHELAVAQYRAGQELNNENYEFRREEAWHLNRIGRTDESIVKLEKIIAEIPGDSEAIAALGRIYREMWTGSWSKITDDEERKKAAFASSHWLVKSINTYLKAYIVDQNNYYPGINALTWSRVLVAMADEFEDIGDPDIENIRDNLPALSGSVQLALEKVTANEDTDYWSLASLAELYATSSDDYVKVARAYKKALTASKKNAFYLQSSIGQLKVLGSLGVDPANVGAGLKVLEDEVERIHAEQDDTPEDHTDDIPDSPTLEYIFLFSGHSLDKADAEKATFPEAMQEEVVTRLADAMTEWEADFNDVGVVTGASAGSEILFIEECLRRNMRVEILLPFEEPLYVQKMIASISDDWVTRYYDLRNNPKVSVMIQTEHVGKIKRGDDPLERNARWAMFSALGKGVDRLRFITLWDGESEPDTPGTIINDMVEDVRGIGGRVIHLNSSKFDYFNKRVRADEIFDRIIDDADPDSTPKKTTRKPRKRVEKNEKKK